MPTKPAPIVSIQEHRGDAIPAALRNLPEWQPFQLTPRENGKWNKVPQPGKASPRETFDDALATAAALRYDGVGLWVEPGSGLFYADYDGDAPIGSLDDLVLESLCALGEDCYIERSLSGKGIHVIAQIPDGYNGPLPNNKASPWEVKTNAYLVVTGDQLQGNGKLTVATEFAAFCDDVVPGWREKVDKAEEPATVEPDAPNAPMEKIIAYTKKHNGKNYELLTSEDPSALYGGDKSSVEMAIVQAIAYYMGPYPGHIDTAYRETPWFKSHLDRQAKWDRGGTYPYGPKTIKAAIKKCNGRGLKGYYEWNDAPEVKGSLNIITVADVEMKPLNYLWPGWVPKGLLTIIAAGTKEGKSLFVYSTLIAPVTTGGLLPDGTRLPDGPGDVIIFNTEDQIAQTIGPRLVAAGADLNRVHVVQHNMTKEGKLSFIDVGADAGAILEETLARFPNTKLIVFDPLLEYLGEINDSVSIEVRRALVPLQKFCGDLDIAVIGIFHLNKNVEMKGLNRISGSAQFTATSRSVILIGRSNDQNDPELRYASCVGANNASTTKSTVPFRISGVDVGNGITNVGLARLTVDIDPVNGTFEELTSPVKQETQRDRAKTILVRLMDEHDCGLGLGLSAHDGMTELRKEGISDRVSAEARGALGLEPHPKTGGPRVRWYWAADVPEGQTYKA